MDGSIAYLDASAVVKLIVVEAESQRLVEALSTWPHRASAVVAPVEVTRAVRRSAPRLLPQAVQVLSTLALVRLSDVVLRSAAEAEPPELRALDAVHLAAAMSLGRDLGLFLAYDHRLLGAAERAGLPALAPA